MGGLRKDIFATIPQRLGESIKGFELVRRFSIHPISPLVKIGKITVVLVKNKIKQQFFHIKFDENWRWLQLNKVFLPYIISIRGTHD